LNIFPSILFGNNNTKLYFLQIFLAKIDKINAPPSNSPGRGLSRGSVVCLVRQ